MTPLIYAITVERCCSSHSPNAALTIEDDHRGQHKLESNRDMAGMRCARSRQIPPVYKAQSSPIHARLLCVPTVLTAMARRRPRARLEGRSTLMAFISRASRITSPRTSATRAASIATYLPAHSIPSLQLCVHPTPVAPLAPHSAPAPSLRPRIQMERAHRRAALRRVGRTSCSRSRERNITKRPPSGAMSTTSAAVAPASSSGAAPT